MGDSTIINFMRSFIFFFGGTRCSRFLRRASDLGGSLFHCPFVRPAVNSQIPLVSSRWVLDGQMGPKGFAGGPYPIWAAGSPRLVLHRIEDFGKVRSYQLGDGF